MVRLQLNLSLKAQPVLIAWEVPRAYNVYFDHEFLQVAVLLEITKAPQALIECNNNGMSVCYVLCVMWNAFAAIIAETT